ncbi:gastrula zinc finger protein XlCGF7.1-like isoform X1 [Corythoichthys intestinalis]|uniref:gastrula zinc finger protein XlCGF7.1-like isoform X1 n=1 Tax=Corythoichthys intestinalis TaxID=161448 RepID=UPI0025A4E8DF|nr:gastrula zinc finger protein XlCGF7.1-like isoform X1 [Corythoichthys intestinalis]
MAATYIPHQKRAALVALPKMIVVQSAVNFNALLQWKHCPEQHGRPRAIFEGSKGHRLKSKRRNAPSTLVDRHRFRTPTDRRTRTPPSPKERSSVKEQVEEARRLARRRKTLPLLRVGQMLFSKWNPDAARPYAHRRKPFGCPFCGKRVSLKGSQLMHVRIHAGDKPFSCSACGASFAVRSALVQHAGERPFTCSFCDKTFSQKVSLTTHRRRLTVEKAFRCDTCAQSFAHRYQLNKHACDARRTP